MQNIPILVVAFLALMVGLQAGCDHQSAIAFDQVETYPNSNLDPEHGNPSILEQAYVGKVYEYHTNDLPEKVLAFYDKTYGAPVQSYQQSDTDITRVYQNGANLISVNLNQTEQGTHIYLSTR